MRTKSKNTKRIKLLIILLLSIIVLGGSILIYRSRNHASNTNPVSQSPEKDHTDGTPLENTNQNAGSEKPNTNQQTPASNDSSISVSISNLSQDTNSVFVRAIISGATSGTCSLKFEKSGKTITQDVPIILQSSYYACQGFTVAKSQFTQKGDWSVMLMATSQGKSGMSEAQNINVQ